MRPVVRTSVPAETAPVKDQGPETGCLFGHSPYREAHSAFASGGFRAQECITAGDR